MKQWEKTILMITEIFYLAKNIPWCSNQLSCEVVEDSANVQAQHSIVMVTEYYGKLPEFCNRKDSWIIWQFMRAREKHYY